MPIIIEQKEAARVLGVTDRTLREWRTDHPDFPDCSAGYDTDAITAWRDAHAKKGSETDSAMLKLKLAQKAEELKQARIETQTKEHKLKVTEGELLPRPAYELFLATILASHADWCEQLPDLLAGDCCKKCKKSLAERVKKELDRRREQLAEDLKRSPQE